MCSAALCCAVLRYAALCLVCYAAMCWATLSCAVLHLLVCCHCYLLLEHSLHSQLQASVEPPQEMLSSLLQSHMATKATLHITAVTACSGNAVDIPLEVLPVLFNLPLLLAEAATGAFAGLGAGFCPAGALRGGAVAGEGCVWLPQVGLRAAALRKDSSSKIQWATGSGVVAVRTCTAMWRSS